MNFADDSDSDKSSGILEDEEDRAEGREALSMDSWAYNVMHKMGWDGHSGLGARNQGRTQPIDINIKNDLFGLGKPNLSKNKYESNISKKKFETGKDISIGDPTDPEEKILEGEKELSSVFCEICDKQYTSVVDFQSHLSSYNHYQNKKIADKLKLSKRTISDLQPHNYARRRPDVIIDDIKTSELLKTSCITVNCSSKSINVPSIEIEQENYSLADAMAPKTTFKMVLSSHNKRKRRIYEGNPDLTLSK